MANLNLHRSLLQGPAGKTGPEDDRLAVGGIVIDAVVHLVDYAAGDESTVVADGLDAVVAAAFAAAATWIASHAVVDVFPARAAAVAVVVVAVAVAVAAVAEEPRCPTVESR